MSAPAGTPDRRSGTYALVFGAVVIAVCVVVLALLASTGSTLAVVAIVADVLLLAGMVVARVAVRAVVPRQWAITGCLLAACALSLGAVVLIAG